MTLADDPDHLQLRRAHRDTVAGAHPDIDRDRKVVGVVLARHGLGPGRLDDLGESLDMIVVTVGGDHSGQVPVPGSTVASGNGGDQLQQSGGIVGGIDEGLLAGGSAAQQVGIVRHRADGDLRDDQAARIAGVGGSAHPDLPGVRHGASLLTPRGPQVCWGSRVVR